MQKDSIKREQSQAGLSFAESEKFRPQVKNKLLLLLALLLTAATGAWAQTETLLTTIESTVNKTFTSGSKTFDEIATVTFSAEVSNDGDNWGWFSNQESDKTITVTAASDAYTITRVKFYSAKGSAFDEEAPFLAIVKFEGGYITKVNGTSIGNWGLNKIEVYGYEGTAAPATAGYTVSLKDGVKDADKWTVKVGEGQAQALPIGGLKGDGSETVTLTYTGRLKVKGVKATSEAAAAEEPVADIVWDVTNISDLYVSDGGPYEKEGVTMSSNSGNVSAMWNNYNDPTQDGISFDLYEYGGYTFTAPTGKAFTKIEMTALASAGWGTSNLGTGWAYFEDETNNIYKVTWTGSAASTVDLLKDADEFYGADVNSIAFYLSEQAAKPAATVTTAPTGAAIVGVGKTTALVSGGVAEGGTMMYKVTTDNTKPASTDGFSDAVPTAQSITASGKVYVWYYVKGDDTHSDSEIAATAIVVPVAIIWDVTNVSELAVAGTGDSYEKEGITLSCNAENAYAVWADEGNPTTAGMEFTTFEYGGFTFRALTGKAFTKIEMTLNGSGEWNEANLGTGWAYNSLTVTWKGTAAASTVDLLKDSDYFMGPTVKSIAFYLVDAE